MATEYLEYEVPAQGDRAGLVVLRPKTFDASIKYRLIIFNPGIGGRGSGSDADLDKISKNDEGYTMTQLETAVKNDGRYIIVSVQPRNLYENGETEEGRIWALNEFKDVIDPERVYLTGLSLGGGGNNRYLATNADASKKFAAVLTLCPGGNSAFIPYDGYKVIAEQTMPILLVHCINDTVVRPEESTFPLVKKIKELNPAVNVQVILFKTGGHSAWKVYGQTPMATPLDAYSEYTYENKLYPAVNDMIGMFLDYFELNRIGQPPKFLPRLSDPKPIPVPVPPIEPIPVEKPARAKIAIINATTVTMPGIKERVPNSILNTEQVYTAGANQRCSGVVVEWTPDGNKYTLDIRNEKNEKLPAIIVGPYK